MSQTPAQRYQALLAGAGFAPDPAQAQAVTALNQLYQALKTPGQPLGLYLWGDVGRGKTMLMDLFFEALDDSLKLRLHFHRFMAWVHEELRQEAGHAEPLALIAKRLRQRCRVLCFDEFFVSDIGDAMLLTRLFQALFAEGLVLVATSNIPMQRLYENGLQRDRFLPGIALLQRHCRQLHLDGGLDHRLRHLKVVPTCFAPGQGHFAALFTQMTGQAPQAGQLLLCNRPVPTLGLADGVAWFDFKALCEGPRSALDYIALAGQVKLVLLSGVPLLGGQAKEWIKARGTEDGVEATATGERRVHYAVGDDPARRFISLVDELYDQKVALCLEAPAPPAALYQGGALAFEFRRTQSRLVEMQSSDYLGALIPAALAQASKGC
ncbi:cell division protein ZapE [Gallaecimonas xiamenensis]|uniref:AFG1 family ATPase n=1 Tax=Gallaecimonas xiamenensis 3-C-1 TaxID=745411 RepID=K2J4S0_9GAMM|nr:cell division protein ZapE [Gallaecimonas xiamenensis]EKE69907.1 AFG1 family ATPase [Gallaecimonas xiamenensis 3-C-1]